ncbi:MAG: hypothetical protein ACR2RL_23300 [Gammaproteobacteria bacterium]
MLVERGEIARLAPEAEFTGFEGERADTTGGTLMPGLTDCHVHLLYAGEPDPAAVVDKRSPADITACALEHARATVRGGITSVEHGIFMSDECIEEMITRGTFLVPAWRGSGLTRRPGSCQPGGDLTGPSNQSGVEPIWAPIWARALSCCYRLVQAVRNLSHIGHRS